MTFRRTPDRLFLAGCAPAEPASASPAEEKLETQLRGSQEEIFDLGLDQQQAAREAGVKNRTSTRTAGDQHGPEIHLIQGQKWSKLPRGVQEASVKFYKKSTFTISCLLFLFFRYDSHAIDISTIEELQMIGENSSYPINGNYILTQDIDASPTSDWNDGKGFDPIDDFVGTLDGQRHVITGLMINQPYNGQHIGLFSEISYGGHIKDLGIKLATVAGQARVGGLAGIIVGSTITSCYVTGSISGRLVVGGLVGVNSGMIAKCYSSCTVSGYSPVGGLVGENATTIRDSYSSGSVYGDNDVGGLVGYSYYASIDRCYSCCSVLGKSSIGGLVGSSYPGKHSNSYWDVNTSGTNYSDGGEGRTTTQMKSQSTFFGWDFINVWNIYEGFSYPWLRGLPINTEDQTKTPTFAPSMTPTISPKPTNTLTNTQTPILIRSATPLFGSMDLAPTGFVDTMDLFTLSLFWGRAGTSGTFHGDFDKDGHCGSKDLLSFLHSWQKGWIDIPPTVGVTTLTLPAAGGTVEVQGAAVVTVPAGAVGSDTPIEAGKIDLVPEDLGAGIVGSLVLNPNHLGVKGIDNYEGPSFPVEFVLAREYTPGTILNIQLVEFSSELGVVPDQGFVDSPRMTFIGEATVTQAGNRTTGVIPSPSGRYIVEEPYDLWLQSLAFKASKEVVSKADKGHLELARFHDSDPSHSGVPVILVHGIDGEDDARENWAGLAQFLDNDTPSEFAEWIYRYDTQNPSTEPPEGLEYNAQIFISSLQADTGIWDAPRIVIVAHSMGGLIARRALQLNADLQAKTVLLLTLATPHHGSPFAHFEWALYGYQEDNYHEEGSFRDYRAVYGVSQRNGNVDQTGHALVFVQQGKNQRDMAWDNYDGAMPIGHEMQPQHKVLLYRKAWLGYSREPLAGYNKGTRIDLPEPADWYLPGHGLSSLTSDILQKMICYGGFLTASRQDVDGNLRDLLAGNNFNWLMRLNNRPEDDESQRQLSRFYSSESSVLSYLAGRLSAFPVKGGQTGWFNANDGAVPLSSALFLKGDVQPKALNLENVDSYLNGTSSGDLPSFPCRKYRIFKNYDHHAMIVGTHETDSFILADIREVVGEFPSPSPTPTSTSTPTPTVTSTNTPTPTITDTPQAPSPIISSISPAQGERDMGPVTITGSNFASPYTQNSLSIGGMPVTLTGGSGTTQLTVATLPVGAPIGNPVQVTVTANSLTSAPYNWIVRPTIEDDTTDSGRPGDLFQVYLTGTATFSTSTGDWNGVASPGEIRVGGVQAKVTGVTQQTGRIRVSATVPSVAAGATQITATYNSATSLGEAFTVQSIGMTNYALSFDGIDDFAATGNTGVLNSLPLTIEAWVAPITRSDGTSFPANTVSNDHPRQTGHGFGLNVWGSSSALISWYHNGGRLVPNITFNSGSWTHIALVYTTGNVRTYVNGIEKDNYFYSQGPLDGDPVVRFGKHNDDTNLGTRRFFKGSLDEVRIWSIARTQSQIQETMSGRLSGNESNLVGYWDFDEGNGQTVKDKSSQNQTASLGGSTNSDDSDPKWIISSVVLK